MKYKWGILRKVKNIIGLCEYVQEKTSRKTIFGQITKPLLNFHLQYESAYHVAAMAYNLRLLVLSRG